MPFPQLDIHLKQGQPGVSEIPASRPAHAKIRSSPA
jgi:small-conductance mechanosensitive channel